MFTQKISSTINKYVCKKCNFTCSKQSIWDKHELTRKHANNHKCLQEKSPVKTFMCECGKIYNYRQSLCVHRKTCINNNNKIEDIIVVDTSANEIKILTNLIIEIVKSNADLQKQNQEFQKQNQEIQKQLLDVCSKIHPSTINTNSHNNNNNKTFNLQFFLNEECKDAMNLNDFVESVQLQMADLEKIGELGYVEGVSKIIMGKLNETDVNKRPVHCSDAKRETLYVKDDNVWTKEGEENLKIRGAVKKIEKKNIRLLNVWKEAHSGCIESDSPYNDQYTHMIIGSLGGCEPDNVNKVIKKIAKSTIIDK